MSTRALSNPVRQDDAPRPVSRRYELRWSGVLYIITSLFLAIGAFNSQNNLLYWAFGVAVCGVVISGIVSGSALMGVSVRRESPETGTVDTPLTIRYRLRNRGRYVPAFALEIRELGETMDAKDAIRAFEPVNAIVEHCAPRRAAVGAVRVVPQRRGVASLRYVKVSTVFPFGLVRKTLIFEQPATIAICPRISPVRRALIDDIPTSARWSEHTARKAGEGVEFYGLREYRQGDPVRMIAWRRSAAKGTMLVRQHTSPGTTAVWITIDDSVRRIAKDDPEGFETAIEAAASFAHELHAGGRAVGLAADWVGVLTHPGEGMVLARRLQVALAHLTTEAIEPAPAPVPSARVYMTIGAGSIAQGDTQGSVVIDGTVREAWAGPARGADRAPIQTPEESAA